MVGVLANGKLGPNRFERKVLEHLARADVGAKPVAYAKKEVQKYKNARTGNGSEISIDTFHVRVHPDVENMDSLQIDMKLRVDGRRFQRRKGSFTHDIAITISAPKGKKPKIVEIAGIAGRDTSNNFNKLNIPSSVALMTRVAIERDLAYVRLRILDGAKFTSSMPNEVKEVIAGAFKTFLRGGQARQFPLIVQSATPVRGRFLSRGLAK